MSEMAGPGYEEPTEPETNEYPYVYATADDPNFTDEDKQRLLEMPSNEVSKGNSDGTVTVISLTGETLEPGQTLQVDEIPFVKDEDNNVYIAGNEDSTVRPIE